MSTAPLNSLVEKVRSMHPGAYDDMDDAALTKAVLAKYPQYSDLAAPRNNPDPRAIAPGIAAPPDLSTMINKDETTARVAGLPGGSPITPPATPAMAAIAGAGIGAGAIAAAPAMASLAAPVAGAATKVIARHPLMTMAGLAAAKKLPIVGPYLEHIPDWLPLLATEGGAGAAEGEAATGAQIERDATRQNAPYAGEEIPMPKPDLAPVYRDATRQNVPYAGEAEKLAAPLPKNAPVADLAKQAEVLRQPVNNIVDDAIPPSGKTQAANLLTKSRIDFHLQRGDVDAAQAVLESAKPGATNTFPPAAPKIVPSVQNIRENDALAAAAQKQGRGYNSTDSLEDRGLSQEMNANLEQHGYRAESEARREFIARNSTGATKQSLIEAAKAQQAITPTLLEQLEESLRIAQQKKKQ